MMKLVRLASAVLVATLWIGTPTIGFAHVGHGDEFQAEGGINRVPVNADTDGMLGITVEPIESATDGSAAVMIPVTALVDVDGKQLVFVQYESFYEPVPVTTGATEGELVEITQGLSVGELLVTQGSLSLYAESRKTQTADNAANREVSPVAQTQAEMEVQGGADSQDSAGDRAQQTSEAPQSSNALPVGLLAAGAVGVVVIGAIALLAGSGKKKNVSSDQ